MIFEYLLSPETVLLYSIVAAAVPALFFTGLIYWADRYEKEPLWLLGATFFWGAIPAIGLALVAGTVLSLPFYSVLDGRTADTIASGVIAPLVEETVKGLVLIIIFSRWRQEIDSWLDGIIYGAMVGMGFAMIENIFYFVDVYETGGPEAWNSIVFMRAIIFGLNHALYTSLTGLGMAIARLSTNGVVRLVAPVAGWSAAVFVHATHNLVVSQESVEALLLALAFDWSGVSLVVMIIFLALWQERRWLHTFLSDEVSRGTLTQTEYQVVQSGFLRARFRLRTLQMSGLQAAHRAGKLFDRYSELAYRKHHYQRFSDVPTRRAIAKIRLEIQALHEKAGRTTQS